MGSDDTGWITGRYTTSDGTPVADAIVTVTASVPRVRWGNTTVTPGGGSLRTNANGAFRAAVAASDGLRVDPQGVTYEVTVTVDRAVVQRVVGITVPAGQVVDMAVVAPRAPGAPVYALQVTAAEFAALADRVDALPAPADLAPYVRRSELADYVSDEDLADQLEAMTYGIDKVNGLTGALEDARRRANHEGTQPASTVDETDDRKWLTVAERAAIAASTVGKVDVQVFLADGTWTKPAGARSVHVKLVAAGGGGGSGAIVLTGTAASGAGGGAGGGSSDYVYSAGALDDTVPVTVGAAGVGGVARLGFLASTAGLPGSSGGAVTFGSYLSASPGGSGAAGAVGAGAGGAAASSGMINGGAGGTGTSGGTGGAAGNAVGTSGGGAGGGISTAGGGANGGLGGAGSMFGSARGFQGNGNSTGNAANGGSAQQRPSVFSPGAGAGGGGASAVAGARSGSGGTGGTYGGGGGGGGSARTDGTTAGVPGAGGPGGPGVCVVTTYLT